MDYTTLVANRSTAGSIQNWINRSTVDPDTVLTEAQALIYTTLRHWKMVYSLGGTMSIGDIFINISPNAPAVVISIKDLFITGNYFLRLRHTDVRNVLAAGTVDDAGNPINQQPTMYYMLNTSLGIFLLFENPPDIAYRWDLFYYGRPPDLSNSNATNFLTTDCPRLLRTACMLIACEYEKEVGQGQFDRTYWQAQFDKQMGEVQATSDIASFAFDATPEFA